MSPFNDLPANGATPALPRVLLVLPPGSAPDMLPFAEFVRDRGLSFTVDTAFGACEALQLLKKGQCDVIVSEYLLGETTVFDILTHAARSTVIVATADGDEVTAVRAFKAGASDYVIKDAAGQYLERIPEAIDKAMRAKASRSLYQTLIHAMTSINDSVFITDMDDAIIFVNKAFCKTYGYSEDEILGREVSLVWDTETRDFFPPAQIIASNGQMTARDALNRRSDGSVFPVSLSRSVVHDDEGVALAVVCVARDITERVQAERELKSSLNEKEVLLREIHHRVKNNLQIISSLLNLQSGFLKDRQTIEALRESQNRVRSMALIHERIYQSGRLSKIDFPAYVQSLADHLLASSRSPSVDVEVEQTELLIDVELAVPCGLIINELLSNSLKHAFPDGQGGTVRVRFSLGKHQETNYMTLDVSDDGVGYPSSLSLADTQSLGLQLIDMLSQQLKGSLTIIRDGGARSLVKIPLGN